MLSPPNNLQTRDRHHLASLNPPSNGKYILAVFSESRIAYLSPT